MFLYRLESTERAPFLELARRVIRSDGLLRTSESSLLERFSLEFGYLEDGHGLSDQSIDELARSFRSQRSRTCVLLELLGLGYSDGALADAEAALLRALAVAFDIDDVQFRSCENWVLRQIALVRDANRLFGES